MLITRAAIMFQDGEVFEGRSYNSVIAIANKLGFTGDKIHGFVTSSGAFVLPEDAVKIAREANQISADKDSLEPEDLWKNVLDD